MVITVFPELHYRSMVRLQLQLRLRTNYKVCGKLNVVVYYRTLITVQAVNLQLQYRYMVNL